jgi:hypothetical protein
MEPTNAELIFWIIVGLVLLGFVAYGLIFNPYYDPKANDPYRYCPKEDEEE